MNNRSDKIERDYYDPVKNWLDKILEEKFASHHLEVTAKKVFSNTLLQQIDKNRDLVHSFLLEAAPDITGFVKKDSTTTREFIVVEIKNTPIKLDDIYQTRKYAELFDARYALLVSPYEIPAKIMRLSEIVYSLLAFPPYKRVALVHFGNDGANVTWYPEDPFMQI